MRKTFALLPLLATSLAPSLLAQYTMAPAPALPDGLPDSYTAVLQKAGYKVTGPNGEWADVWLSAALPSGSKSTEQSVSFPTIPHGTLLGVIRFPAAGADRRGQSIKPGVYTLRYSTYPITGDHVGVAPQRDFAVLTPIAGDPDPNAAPKFDTLMTMSRKASGTPHPAVLSLETPGADAKVPSIVQEGEKDWALNFQIGDTQMAIILVGKSEA